MLLTHKRENEMAPASLEGQTLGRYRVLEPLGRGGMARVYRAYHPQLDRYVAIKVLRSDLVEDEEFLTRFQREAQAVAGLRHPNIVQVFDSDVQDAIYYMVLELLEGDTLKTRLNDYRVRGEKMPLGEAVRILLDVLDGLAYAHSEGMTHRDIKPANVLLTRRGQAVVTDFGIAQIVGGTRHTVPGALMGTLNYMAPEQGMEGHSDARSDVYSLGIVFYEMLTQRTPFEADTPLAVLMKHVNDPLPLPRKMDPSIPEPFERIVLKALAKKPDDRYQSAEEMAQALRQATEEAEIELPPRISLPLSFTTAEAPSESVAVFSGTARAKIADVEFADEDTDATLGQRLAAERAAREKKRAGIQLKVWSKLDSRVGRAILNAIGVVTISNLVMLMVSLPTGWWLFEYGWPMQLFLVSLGLCFVMWATSSIWMLIPTGIILGTGILLTYSSLTGNWRHWIFLWAFQVCFIIGSIWVSVSLARPEDRARKLSRLIAGLIGISSVALILFVALAALLKVLFVG
jgi:tRNA A-37 threonylcarbamoyl transferase component Bud32